MRISCSKSARLFWALVLVILNLQAAFADEKGKPSDKAAMVNGSVITVEEYDRELNQIQQRIARSGRKFNETQMSQIKKTVLENLISRELLFQESTKRGVTVTDEQVSERLKSMKSRLPGAAQYQQMLKDMNITEKDILSRIRKEEMINEFINQNFGAKISISEKEAKAYYDGNPKLFKQPEKVKASHILIKSAPKATEAQKKEAREKLEKIHQRLKAGEDFAALAKALSEGPSGPRGGDLGYFSREAMVKPFSDAAFSLQNGQISDIVETRFGYHLIKVFDKKAESKMEFAQAKDRIETFLKRDKIREKVGALLDQLKKTATVERYK